MDELEISGKRYISTKRIARENKYHPDYMGQLIRAGRISGTKVGRAWYVDEASLAEYLGKERGAGMPAQNPSSPESGKSSAKDFPTSGAVAPSYIPAELVSAPVASTVVSVSNSADEGAPQRDGARTEQFSSKKIAYPESAAVAGGNQIRTYGVIEKKVPVKTSLTYIPDNSPLFPAIQKRTRPVEIKREEYAAPEMAKVAEGTVAPNRSGWKTGLALMSLAVVAGVFFSFAFFGSLGIDSTLIVEKGKPASVEFAQEKTFCFIFGNCQNGQK